jgi:hypothetical protein
MDWGREMAFINHFYFYLWDSEWGGAFWKTNAYAPFPIWLWLNGHEWAKRQMEKSGIEYDALDNGFRATSGPAALQRVCDRLVRRPCRAFSDAGCGVCHRRSARPTSGPATDIKWCSASLKFPIPVYSTGRKRVGCGLKE